jgi:hypothetical protein
MQQIPLSGSGSSSGFFSLPDKKGEQSPANIYPTDEHGVHALGAKLSAGTTFDATAVEFRPYSEQGLPPWPSSVKDSRAPCSQSKLRSGKSSTTMPASRTR